MEEAVMPQNSQNYQSGTSRHVEIAYQELSKQQVKNYRYGRSRTADTAPKKD